MDFIKRSFKLLIGIVMLILVVIAYIIGNRYSKLDSVAIELCDKGNSCITVDSDKYNESKVKKYLLLMSFRDTKAKVQISCNYKIVLNGENEICYDGGEFANYKEKVTSAKDVKDKIQGNKITDVKYKSKIIKMNKSLGKLLKELN